MINLQQIRSNCGHIVIKDKIILAEFLAIIDKLIIQSNQNLSPVEKEVLKQGIDEIKKMAQQ